MTDDRRLDLIEDIIDGLAHGEVANSLPAFANERVDDGSVLTVDLGEPDWVYGVTVTVFERID